MKNGSCLELFCIKGVFKNIIIFIEKYQFRSSIFTKVAALRLAALFKKRLWQSCFSVNFAKFIRAYFCIVHLQWLLLMIEQHVLKKIKSCQRFMNKTVLPEIVNKTLAMESENSQNIVEKLCKKERCGKRLIKQKTLFFSNIIIVYTVRPKTYLLCFFLKMSQNKKIIFVLKITVKPLNSISSRYYSS